MGKTKRELKKASRHAVPEVRNAYGLDAAAWSPARSFNFFPVASRRDLSTWSRWRLISRARSLEFNSPEVRAAVKTIGMLVGTLKPLPCTRDEEWNRLAADAFARRTGNPRVFDHSGALNFAQLQTYAEERAVVDGDVLIVFTRTPDGGGGVCVYPADQLQSEKFGDGVITTKGGRPVAYAVRGESGDWKVGVDQAHLYKHNPDPTDPRGLTDLVACITTAQDLYELNSFNKQAVKLAASLGLIETVDVNTQRPGVQDLLLLRNGAALGGEDSGSGETPAPPPPPPPLVVDGMKAVTLTPGHKLETVHDTRPSTEVRNFAKDLVDAIAYSVGLDPEILYRAKEMGSASVRFVIAKAKDWARPRIADKELLCTRIWRHVIACEVASGRLRPCRDYEGEWDVKWVGTGKWSIDLGRDAASAINLINSGLMSANDYTLETTGMTRAEILEEAAKDYAAGKEVCERMGVTLQELFPGLPGQTVLPQGGAEQETKQENGNEVDI